MRKNAPPGHQGEELLANLPYLALDDDVDASHRPRPRLEAASFLTPHGLRWACIGIHISVIIIHIVLLGVWSHHAEHRVVVPLAKSENVSTVLVIVSQIFGTLLTVALVTSTQQLALRGTFLRYQTLTATHDGSSAWSGLGSALASVWRQTYIAASVSGTLYVTAYLSGIAILNVTTPSLFGMQPFNNTDRATISTRIGMPNMTVNETYVFSWEVEDECHALLECAANAALVNVRRGFVMDVQRIAPAWAAANDGLPLADLLIGLTRERTLTKRLGMFVWDVYEVFATTIMYVPPQFRRPRWH
ncbi:hypothetical protein PLICRDRAFT_600359 [Plicaturopsis crispa FD-325 SS-3]|nr:hypothetical protein PLICRDRAFT_600359 [Plicaturopsis crispa FD-325 SS-3]